MVTCAFLTVRVNTSPVTCCKAISAVTPEAASFRVRSISRVHSTSSSISRVHSEKKRVRSGLGPSDSPFWDASQTGSLYDLGHKPDTRNEVTMDELSHAEQVGRAQPSSQPNPLNPLNPRNPRNLACISYRRIVQAMRWTRVKELITGLKQAEGAFLEFFSEEGDMSEEFREDVHKPLRRLMEQAEGIKKGLEKRNEVPVEETPQVEADKKRQRVEAAEDVLGFVKDAKMLVQRMNDSGLLWKTYSDEHVLAVAKMIQKQSARPARA